MQDQLESEIATLSRALGPIISDGREIDRKLHAAKKRPRVIDGENANALRQRESSWGPDQDAESDFWKEKFDRLRKDKSKGLQDLEDDLRAAVSREEAAAKACKQLEAKISGLQAGDGADASSDKLASQRRLLAFYELMSSMSVKEGRDEEEFVCTVKNALQRTAVQFTIANKISSSSSGGEDASTGVHFRPTANLDMLPDYLRAAIACEPDYCPILLADVLGTLHQDDPDGQEG